MSSNSPQEPRSWEEPEDLDRLLNDLRDQIEGLRARVTVYRSVISRDDEDDAPSRP